VLVLGLHPQNNSEDQRLQAVIDSPTIQVSTLRRGALPGLIESAKSKSACTNQVPTFSMKESACGRFLHLVQLAG
jgi:hypothetical protein